MSSSERNVRKQRKFILISGYCRIESDSMNIISGIISIIFEYHRLATWSNEFKGKHIDLFEDETKAVCNRECGYSVRGDFPICRGEIITWELECKTMAGNCNFFGVVSSEVDRNKESFYSLPAYSRDINMTKNQWGVDDAKNYGWCGGNRSRLNWEKPEFVTEKEVFVLKFMADWTDNDTKHCKLTIWHNGQKLNNKNNTYTMLLPVLDDIYVWYPCVTPYNTDAYCIIRFV